jgi:hypothetical protein
MWFIFLSRVDKKLPLASKKEWATVARFVQTSYIQGARWPYRRSEAVKGWPAAPIYRRHGWWPRKTASSRGRSETARTCKHGDGERLSRVFPSLERSCRSWICQDVHLCRISMADSHNASCECFDACTRTQLDGDRMFTSLASRWKLVWWCLLGVWDLTMSSTSSWIKLISNSIYFYPITPKLLGKSARHP